MKKDLLTKMIIIGVSGLAALILTILLIWVFSVEKKPRAKNDFGIQENPQEHDLSAQMDSLNGEKAFGLIRLIEHEVIKLYDFAHRKELLLNVKGGTSIKSEYGEQIALSQLRRGMIVEGRYDASNFEAYQIQISGKAWEKNKPTGFILSTEQNKVKIGTEEYRFDPTMIMVTKGSGMISVGEISKFDELILRGYKSELWSIEVLAGHGFLILKNAEAFVGGTMEIGNRDIRTVENNMKLEIPSGPKKVIITKENMNPYSGDIFIEEGKETVIDLSEFKPKEGKVVFKAKQKEITLYIDEVKQALANTEVSLPYGQYKLRAEKEGFIPWESILTVNQVNMEVVIDMKQEAQYLEVQTPAGAELYLDGNRVGIIPVKTAITEGTHMLTIRKDGYYAKQQSIYVEKNGKNVNYAFPDLVKIGSNPETNSPNPPTPPTPPTPNPVPNLNPTNDSYGKGI